MTTVHYHIWRYDSTTPQSEKPWILSTTINGTALSDPPCFETFTEAVEALDWQPIACRVYDHKWPLDAPNATCARCGCEKTTDANGTRTYIYTRDYMLAGAS